MSGFHYRLRQRHPWKNSGTGNKVKQKLIYRVKFYNQGDIYELFAREVTQSNMYAFVEVADILFDKRTELVVDPSEEKLKLEFAGVKRSYIPLQSIIRIDEVSKEGQAKITSSEPGQSGNIRPFPLPPGPSDKT